MDGSPKSSDDDPDPDPDPTTVPDTGRNNFDDPEAGGAQSAPWPSSPRPAEPAEAVRREKGRVRFNSAAALTNRPISTSPVAASVSASTAQSFAHEHSHHHEAPISRPRPSALRGNSQVSVAATQDIIDAVNPRPEQTISALAAQERARQVAEKVHKRSSPPEAKVSLESFDEGFASDGELLPTDSGIPLRQLAHPHHASTSEEYSQPNTPEDHHQDAAKKRAYELVRAHTRRYASGSHASASNSQAPREPHVIPSELNDGLYDGVYDVPAPEHYRGSVLSQLLKLYKPPEVSSHQRNISGTSSAGGQRTPGDSGTATPNRRKWYEQNRSQDTLANLVEASTRLANPNTGSPDHKGAGKKRPPHKRTSSHSRLSAYLQKEEEIGITVHIAETLARQDYIIKLCRALMLFGAPTHRLEEYLSMSARVLEIDGQFLYLPGCMIISFDDKSTHTTEVSIVRTSQGIDLGKLKDVHHVYKEVMHDVIGVEEGTTRLEEIMTSREKFRAWLRVLVFGITSAVSAPFSFKARLIDLPLCFCFGSVVGLLQIIVSPKSQLYSNVFEISATILVSFLARAFGSIAGGSIFCFSALAQGGIVMLLPGYAVLCSALELQSHAIVPGSIRIVYAIIYSLFLGYGITVGATIYGLIDQNATSATTCQDPISSNLSFIFVPFFVLCVSVLYQAKWRQMPAMIVIAFTGYIVNHYSSLRFAAAPQIANTLGALAVGLLANFYSRLRHGVAAATLIPAIFTQVPGGLASTGGLLSGLSVANELTNSTQAVNGTTSVPFQKGETLSTVVFDVAASMIQIAIGIAVGLFMSALIIYPLGKRRSGLFSF